jgi:hypothetical protein
MIASASLPFFLGLAFFLPLSPARADSFFGLDCGGGCERQQAGYEWARNEGIATAAECAGDEGFVEGCRAFFEEGGDDQPITDDENYEDSAKGGTDLSGVDPGGAYPGDAAPADTGPDGAGAPETAPAADPHGAPPPRNPAE